MTGEPLILDDVLYDNDLLAGPRRYDIRGTRVRGDLISLSWRDVTERSDARRNASPPPKEQFRLLAENMADVVVRLSDDGVITWISQVCGAGARRDRLSSWIGRHAMDFAVPDDRGAARERPWTG